MDAVAARRPVPEVGDLGKPVADDHGTRRRGGRRGCRPGSGWPRTATRRMSDASVRRYLVRTRRSDTMLPLCRRCRRTHPNCPRRYSNPCVRRADQVGSILPTSDTDPRRSSYPRTPPARTPGLDLSPFVSLSQTIPRPRREPASSGLSIRSSRWQLSGPARRRRCDHPGPARTAHRVEAGPLGRPPSGYAGRPTLIRRNGSATVGDSGAERWPGQPPDGWDRSYPGMEQGSVTTNQREMRTRIRSHDEDGTGA